MTNARGGFYCIIQFQPDRFRREGANIGVLLVSDIHKKPIFRFVETTDRIRCMFPDILLDSRRLMAATRALEKRIADIDCTEDTIRDFISKESSQLVLLPTLRVWIRDPRNPTDMMDLLFGAEVRYQFPRVGIDGKWVNITDDFRRKINSSA